MKNEQINEMWKEISKLTIGGEKSTRYMVEFLSDDERKAIRKEYAQWCDNESKTSTGGWSACMSYEYSKEAQRDIIVKHVKESVVTLSVDGRKALMTKVMDMAEKLLARFGLEMPEIKWQSYNVSTVKKDKLTLNALDFTYRGANETEEKVIDRCMNMFFAYVYFYGKGVKEYFDAHGLTYTKRTGKGYDEWKKMVLEDMEKKEKKETKAEEKKEEKSFYVKHIGGLNIPELKYFHNIVITKKIIEKLGETYLHCEVDCLWGDSPTFKLKANFYHYKEDGRIHCYSYDTGALIGGKMYYGTFHKGKPMLLEEGARGSKKVGLKECNDASKEIFKMFEDYIMEA